MTNSFNPAVPEKSNDILLGEGVVYVNYGEAGEAIIGATRGGSKLEIDKTLKEIGYDGAYGPTKDLRRYERYVVKLIINLLKLNYTTLCYGVPVTVSDGSDIDGTYKKISFDLDFEASDVLDNVTFAGQKQDGSYCIIKVENALNIDNLSFAFNEKDELVSEMTYTGFYTYAAPTIPPLVIHDEVA